MLDRYWWGKVERISPEAPVPVVRLGKKTSSPGGAANVAANIIGLGAKAILVGYVGTDPEAEELKQALQDAGIPSDGLLTFAERPTTVKTRVVAHGQHVVRVDEEASIQISDEEGSQAVEALKRSIAEADIIVISDYAKGFLTADLLTFIFEKVKELGKKVIVDPKGIDYSKYRGASMITPNQKETAEACKLDINDEDLAKKAADILIGELQLETLLVTQGENGMTLIDRSMNISHLPAATKQIFDVTGAGDTVVAALAVSLAVGHDYRTAASIANTAAGIAVGKVGTTIVTADMLRDTLQE